MIKPDIEGLSSFAVAFSENYKKQRDAMPGDDQLALQKIVDGLSDAADPPDYFKESTTALEKNTDAFIYRHTLPPQLELTYRLYREDKKIFFTDVANPKLAIPKNVFISYSHKNKVWLERLRLFIDELEKRGLIKIWTDKEIRAGEVWNKEIEESLTNAKIALLLVTQEFLASEFISKNEIPKLLEKASKKEMLLFWIAVESSNFGLNEYNDELYKKYQALNNPEKPLRSFTKPKRDLEFISIVSKINDELKK